MPGAVEYLISYQSLYINDSEHLKSMRRVRDWGIRAVGGAMIMSVLFIWDKMCSSCFHRPVSFRQEGTQWPMMWRIFILLWPWFELHMLMG